MVLRFSRIRVLVVSLFFLATPNLASADCSNPVGLAGEMKYFTDYSTVSYCDGTNWIAMGHNNYSADPATSSLTLLDLTVGTDFSQGPGASIIFSGNYAYVPMTSDSGVGSADIVVYDISNPNNLTEVATVVDADILGIVSMFKNGNYIYLSGATGVAVIDITNPTSPTVRGKLFDPMSFTNMHNSAIIGTDLFIVQTVPHMIFVFDMSDPDNPVLRSSRGGGNVQRITSNGNYIYIPGSDLWVLDASDPNNLITHAHVTAPGWVSSLYNSIIIVGDYLYTVNVSSDNLFIFDVSNPGAPVFVKGYDSTTFPSIAHHNSGIAVNDQFLVLGGSNNIVNGFSVFEISDRESPVFVGDMQSIPNFTSITFRGDTIRQGVFYGSSKFSKNFFSVDIDVGLDVGLVGHWKLDETSGATISDSSGNGNDGIWSDGGNNDVAEETTIGQYDTALDFSVSSGNVIANIGDISTQYTISFWYKNVAAPNTLITDQGISWNSLSDNGINFSWDHSAASFKQAWGIYSSGWKALQYTTPLQANEWYLLTLTYDGTTYRSYLNGVEEVSSILGAATDAGVETFNIGAGRGGTNSFDDGIIDDVRVYSRSLSDDEVSKLYCQAITGTIEYNPTERVMQFCSDKGWVAMGPKPSINNGLVGHWPLDETTGAVIADSSGNGNDGTWIDGTGDDVAEETVVGNLNNALDFDGVDDIIDTGIDIDYGAGNEISLSAWIKYTSCTNSNGNMCYIISKYRFDGGTPYNLQVTAGRPEFYINGTAIIAASNTYDDDEWHHVTATFDGTTSSLYVDGIIQGTATPTPLSNDLTVRIGSSENDPTYRPFNGKIDDVRIYNRTLSVAEVGELYALKNSCTAPTTNLVGHWKLDETSGAVIADSAGVNTGTWTDGTGDDVTEETTAGQDSTALIFDGINDEITLSNEANFDFVSDFTVSTWVKLGAGFGSNYRGILAKWDNALGGSWDLGIHTDGAVRMYVRGTSGIAGGHTLPKIDLRDGLWHLITSTATTTGVKIYIDGNYIGEELGTWTPTLNNYNVKIGTRDGAPFLGSIDDTRIYNRVLTPAEISELYGATGGICDPPACSAPDGRAGELLYNTDVNAMQYCNGNSWVAVGK